MTFALSDPVRGLVVLSVHPRQAEVAPGAAMAGGKQYIEELIVVSFGSKCPTLGHETDMAGCSAIPLLNECGLAKDVAGRASFDPFRTFGRIQV